MSGATIRLRREAAEFNNRMKLTKRRRFSGRPASRAGIIYSRFAAYAQRWADIAVPGRRKRGSMIQ